MVIMMDKADGRLKTSRGVSGGSQLLLSCWLVLQSLCVLAADEISCPASVEARYSISDKLTEWDVVAKSQSLLLHHVEFFVGAPEKMASLIPDIDEKAYAVWSFGNEEIWLGCFYDGSVISLTKRLPGKIDHCKVKYDEAKHVAPGASLILGIECY